MKKNINQLNFSEDLGEDLMKYIKVYVDEIDAILERVCERREVLDILSQDDINTEELEDADEEILALAKDPEKRAEVRTHLEEELNEDQKQHAEIDTLIRGLLDEVGKRIEA